MFSLITNIPTKNSYFSETNLPVSTGYTLEINLKENQLQELQKLCIYTGSHLQQASSLTNRFLYTKIIDLNVQFWEASNYKFLCIFFSL